VWGGAKWGATFRAKPLSIGVYPFDELPMRRPSLARRLAAFAAAALFSLGILGVALHGTARAAARVSRVADVLPAIVRRALAQPNTRWVRAEGPHVRVYATDSVNAMIDVEQLRAHAEAARAANLALLGDPASPQPLHLVYVPNREGMRPLVGATPGGTADPLEFAAAMVTSDSMPAPVRHETMHILAQQAWGRPNGAWVREGLATYAAGKCAGRNLHTVAAALAADGRLVRLADLPGRFDVKGEQGAAMYIQSGSVVKYVAESYGTDKLRKLYRDGLVDSAAVAASVAGAMAGLDAARLEREWRRTVARSAGREPWRRIYADIQRHGCE
jgi:hypothetical protein